MELSSDKREKLEHYVALLKKWQKSINLVSTATLDDVWQRHILDSAQLSSYIPENACIMDMGSGAGFPGLVLAIIRSDLKVTLIESDGRKCAFLRTVSRETSTATNIVNQRIESISPDDYRCDVITARALAPLKDLLDYTLSFHKNNKNIFCLFLKGENAEKELEEAQKIHNLMVETFPGQAGNGGTILKITLK